MEIQMLIKNIAKPFSKKNQIAKLPRSDSKSNLTTAAFALVLPIMKFENELNDTF
jgi:hypothetical protein